MIAWLVGLLGVPAAAQPQDEGFDEEPILVLPSGTVISPPSEMAFRIRTPRFLIPRAAMESCVVCMKSHNAMREQLQQAARAAAQAEADAMMAAKGSGWKTWAAVATGTLLLGFAAGRLL